MEALGIYIEGQILKLAHIKKHKDRLKILAVESTILPEPLTHKDQGDVQDETAEPETNEDAFGLPQERSRTAFETGAQVKKIDSERIVELLRKYPVHRAPLAISLPESSVLYTEFTNTDHLKGRQLKQRLRDGAPVTPVSTYAEGVGPFSITADDNTFLLLNQTGSIPFLEHLLEVKPLIDRKMAIPLITTSEIALARFASLLNGSAAVPSSVIVRIEADFARILILRNGVLMRVSPVINLERNTKDIVDTLDMIYARILFELDQVNIPVPDKLFLCGELHSDQPLTYFRVKFSDTPCAILTDASVVDTSLLEPEQKGAVASFAVPIGLASGVLIKTEKAYLHTNFLPKSLKKEQSSARLAWHGYAVLFLLFLSTLLYTFQWHTYSSRKEQAEFSLSLVAEALETERHVAHEISALDTKTSNYLSSIALVDSLWNPGPLYSDELEYLSNSTRELNSLWIKRFIMRNDDFQLSGASVYRTRIHWLAKLMGDAVIKNMEEEKIRNNTIYNFGFSGNPQKFVPTKRIGLDLPEQIFSKNNGMSAQNFKEEK